MSTQVGFIPTVAATSGASSRTPFRAIVWKECREGWKIGVIGFAIVACTRLFSLGLTEAMTSGDSTQFVATGPTTSFFTLTSAIVALLIGGAAVHRENRGDMRALLVHRPVDSSTLFWGKVIASALWYVVAVGIPFAIFTAIRLHRRGLDSPFVPAMLLPDVADALAALMYVPVGMLVMLRRARWFGSRLAPLGAGVAISGNVIAAFTFPTALGCIAIGLTLLVMAARSTFIAGGYYTSQATPSRVVNGVVIALGIVMFGAVLVAIIDTYGELETLHGEGYRRTELVVASDASLVRVTRDYHELSARSIVVSVRDTSGNIISQPSDTAPRLANGHHVSDGVFSTANIPLNPSADYETTGRHGYRGTEDFYIPFSSGLRFGQTFWYYLRGAHVLDVYASRRGHSVHVGWLGPDGFLAGDTMPTHRFIGELRPYAEYSHQQPLIAFPDAVYRIDFRNRAIHRVFTPPIGEVVLGAASSGDSTADAKYPPRAQFDAIATTKHVYIQAFDGAPKLVLPRDPMAAKFGSLQVIRPSLAADSSTFVWYRPSYGTLTRTAIDTARDQIAKFATDGRQMAHASLVADITPVSRRTQWIQIGAEGFAQGLPGHAFETWQSDRDELPRYRARGAAAVAGWIAALVGSLLAAILIAIIARRYAFESRRQLGWIVAGALLGPLGVLLLLSLPEWPARVACPSCHDKRIVTRDHCEHCDAPFASPPMDGTEIFEDAQYA
jgi:hypothetical protein